MAGPLIPEKVQVACDSTFGYKYSAFYLFYTCSFLIKPHLEQRKVSVKPFHTRAPSTDRSYSIMADNISFEELRSLTLKQLESRVNKIEAAQKEPNLTEATGRAWRHSSSPGRVSARGPARGPARGCDGAKSGPEEGC